jgi:hypothetical protein
MGDPTRPPVNGAGYVITPVETGVKARFTGRRF